jgi:hypothetical protein
VSRCVILRSIELCLVLVSSGSRGSIVSWGRKPRRTKYQSDKDYNTELKAWKASLLKEEEVIPQGNLMTEKYYCDNILPIYIAAIHEGRLKRPGNWLLQEDNDSSHSTHSNNLAAKLRAQNWINTLVHPAQSPDLNPIEAI